MDELDDDNEIALEEEVLYDEDLDGDSVDELDLKPEITVARFSIDALVRPSIEWAREAS